MFNINSDDELYDELNSHVQEVMARAGFTAVISRQRVIDSYLGWKQDMKRSHDFNFGDAENVEPDHVKCAAHLSYWIRRFTPIVDVITNLDVQPASSPLAPSSSNLGMYDPTEMLRIELGSEGEPVVEQQGFSDQLLKHRKRLMAYANEYVAFDLGFRLAKTYELEKLGNADNDFVPDLDFIDTICYFLKFKNVSPHALYLIYKALLFKRFN